MFLSAGKHEAESVTVQSPYYDWYSYQVNTLTRIENDGVHYQWFSKTAYANGWFPGGQ